MGKIEKESNPKLMIFLRGQSMLGRFGFNEPSSGFQNGESSVYRTTIDV